MSVCLLAGTEHVDHRDLREVCAPVWEMKMKYSIRTNLQLIEASQLRFPEDVSRASLTVWAPPCREQNGRTRCGWWVRWRGGGRSGG